MKSKKSANSIKKEEHTTAGCSKDKFWEREKCKIKITNLSESIPNKFFEEMSKNVGKEAICKFEEGYVEITFDCHLNGHLFANYVNNLAIGDTILKTTFLHKDCKKGIPKLDETRKEEFRRQFTTSLCVVEIFSFRNCTLSCESYKTIECEKPECDEASCIFYHSEMDRRRNPYTVPYRSVTCKSISDSPETFFTKFWCDTLLFGTPLAVEFLAGAITKFNLYNSAYKDTRIFMMGASMPFLDNVRKAVNEICTIHALKNDFVGALDLAFGTSVYT
ncbi:hypothetical protein Anas_03252 [Armadillidium nasatum]|uniref:Uncharacterized protein n=1 Tax=Armadillidium nasatum TaxID=96803 RepID=A0A5N5SYM8_9CRUS|nr:hypothetical protein Anas_03252 [Armadillidium nasatum]